jgi:hypothetical protein
MWQTIRLRPLHNVGSVRSPESLCLSQGESDLRISGNPGRSAGLTANPTEAIHLRVAAARRSHSLWLISSTRKLQFSGGSEFSEGPGFQKSPNWANLRVVWASLRGIGSTLRISQIWDGHDIEWALLQHPTHSD